MTVNKEIRMARTPHTTIRINPHLRAAATLLAMERGMSLSELIRYLLIQECARHEHD